MTGHHTLTETERAVHERLGDLPLDFRAMAAVSNLHRAVNAIRNHLEQAVLKDADLTWTGFVVLWVIWIWGDMETRHVAAEAGISKGTLTGVMKTLEARGLVARTPHSTDGRLVLLGLTPAGSRLMQDMFPRFNTEETYVLKPLDGPGADGLAATLRAIIGHLEEDGPRRRAQLRATP
ncbi:MarR family winged helix-turn-helix transcriptional regulator [Bailinhaonella thermotolerans]|uniref:MarR family transcriptional regulator n=1 Tax=Bailinhaonella thermotolerans TaxID=1070861 RepID=A0A3A4AST7_9ACTN|nr:MarR family winged helix-turn-helix transcriptional regulator [Bailinhaonella thermotolerans]RJL30364.1 MarR family transcriptional regulator [Bailinhaonella thermotolerans]